MFSFLKPKSPSLEYAIALAKEMAAYRRHTVYVVHVCDDDYDVTSQVPERYEYKVDP